MKPVDACEFLFTGSVLVPPFLCWWDEPAMAVMAFVLLLVGGALAASLDSEAPFRDRRG